MTRPITQAEWDAYDWIDVRHMRHPGQLFLRGTKRSGEKPRDGYAYVEERVTNPETGQSEYRWVRAETDSPPLEQP